MRRWIWILLAILAVGMVSCAGLVGGGIWYASTHFTMREIPQKDVDVEFKRIGPRSRRSRCSTPHDSARHRTAEARVRPTPAAAENYACWLDRGAAQAVQFCLHFCC